MPRQPAPLDLPGQHKIIPLPKKTSVDARADHRVATASRSDNRGRFPASPESMILILATGPIEEDVI